MSAPECDSAIEDIVNEAIVSDLDDSPVEIELSNLPASDKLKEIIREEFKTIKNMMNLIERHMKYSELGMLMDVSFITK